MKSSSKDICKELRKIGINKRNSVSKIASTLEKKGIIAKANKLKRLMRLLHLLYIVEVLIRNALML